MPPVNRIVYRKWVFEGKDIAAGEQIQEVSLSYASLSAQRCTVKVKCSDSGISIFNEYEPITIYYQNGHKIFYVQKIKRVADRYEISAIDAIGLLIYSKHMGGIYTGQAAEELIPQICGSVPVIVQSPLNRVKLYGWLPVATRRDNLSQVLFALGATVKTDLNGVLRVAGLWNGIIGKIGPERIYQNAGADYGSKVTQVSVTEHQYIQGGEVTQLFQGATRAGDLITFPGPMYGLTATGFSIWESGANYAIVSEGSGKLEGRAYIHNTRQITKDIASGGTPNVKSVTEATLVSLVNSQAVVERLAAYYKSAETVDASVVYQGETPGDVLLVHHPYDGTTVKACLESADITLSNTLKAQAKLLVGYVPPKPNTGYYDAMAVFTQDGDWTAPVSGLVQAVLIGGGDGGGAGEAGQSGKFSSSRFGEGGDGGQAGQYGAGGRIHQVSIQVTAGQSYHVAVGRGGFGGTQAAPAGAAGTPTTFGMYSSASGASSPGGFYEETSGRLYATKGADGVAGGKGNENGSNVVYKGLTYTPGANAGGVSYNNLDAYGGRGGGPAAGANGNPGSDGYMDGGIATGGNGGRGAAPVPGENGTIPGQGGGGGHGGGGGGGNGGATGNSSYIWPGNPGSGAPGSNGGSGANGVLILYYSLPVQTRGGALVDANKRIVLDRLGRLIIRGG